MKVSYTPVRLQRGFFHQYEPALWKLRMVVTALRAQTWAATMDWKNRVGRALDWESGHLSYTPGTATESYLTLDKSPPLSEP